MARPGVNDGTTEASVLMQDHIGEPVGGADLGIDGVVNELPPAGADSVFGMTDYDKQTFGLLPHEVHISIRDGDTDEWKKVDPGRFRQIQYEYQGQARRLTDAAGNRARPLLPGRNDQELVAVPRALFEEKQRQHSRETLAQLEEADPTHGRRGSFDRASTEQIEEAADESHSRLEAIADENRFPGRLSQGIIGNTSGLSLAQAMALIPQAMREEEATRYRQGARYQGLTDEAFGEALTGVSPKKTYGVGRGLGNDNPNSALAQAKAARARENAASSGGRR